MKRWAILLWCCLGMICWLPGRCEGGRRAPGKYCGVVVFDRWDGCTLYSGVFVMYVSEKVKDGLRPYAGRAIQIDAKEVHQPMNPGDGLIGKFEYLGAAPKNRAWLKLAGLHLKSSVKIDEEGKAVAKMLVENRGDDPVKLFRQQSVCLRCEGQASESREDRGQGVGSVTRRFAISDPMSRVSEP